MDNKIEIKELFFLNENLYKKNIKKNNQKKKLILITSTIIEILLIYILIFFLQLGIPNNIKIAVVIIIFGLLLINLFVFFYYLMIWLTLTDSKKISDNDCYAITTNDELLYLNFSVCNERKPSIKQLNDLINDLTLENLEEDIKKTKENKNHILIGHKILKIYKIKEKQNRIDLNCEYINLENGQVRINKNYSIYNFYDNYEQLKKYIYDIKKNKQKYYKNTFSTKLSSFQYELATSKKAITWPLFVLFICIITKEILVGYLLALNITIIHLFLVLKYLKYTNIQKEKNELNNIKIKCLILTIIYLLLFIINSLIECKEISDIIENAKILAVFMFLNAMIIIRMNK